MAKKLDILTRIANKYILDDKWLVERGARVEMRFLAELFETLKKERESAQKNYAALYKKRDKLDDKTIERDELKEVIEALKEEMLEREKRHKARNEWLVDCINSEY